MKKIILIAITVFTSLSLQAQGIYFGGSLGAWTKNDGNLKTNTITFYPEVGYSFENNFHAGIALGLGQIKIGDDKTSEFKFKPYVGYTFYQNEIAALFVEGALSFLHTKPPVGDSFNGFEIGLNPGISVSLAKNLSMRAHFGFLGYRKHSEKQDEFGVRFDAESLRFGFHYSF